MVVFSFSEQNVTKGASSVLHVNVQVINIAESTAKLTFCKDLIAFGFQLKISISSHFELFSLF